MLLHYLGKADQAKYALKETENLKKHPQHYQSYLDYKLVDFNNIRQKYFRHNWLLNKCFSFYLTQRLL